ncbi:MAG: hypothetical protein WCD65_03665, partial [Pseudolabrys sp.]
TGAPSRFLTLLATRGLGEAAHGKTVPNIPSDPRQLACAISHACDKAGKWSAHTYALNYITYIRLTAEFSA